MKKTLLITLLLITAISFSQEEEKVQPKVKKHELKANAFNLIVFKAADFSYEYLIDSESSFGASLLFNLHDKNSSSYNDGPHYQEKFAFTPFYRRYFSSKYAWGFFLETFGMYNVQENSRRGGHYDYVNDVFINSTSTEKANNIAFGVAVGAKFVSRNGFAFEFFGGVGRNVFSSNDKYATELVPRLGASFGYRF
ncbi:MAG TPA: DUF3575 domain-containing protein [Flavobacteriaceae bacterium]|jgi:hypothetical protein|nr:DUF3575 domain-containing protein [Flavobacteriaceae bacterium]